MDRLPPGPVSSGKILLIRIRSRRYVASDRRGLKTFGAELAADPSSPEKSGDRHCGRLRRNTFCPSMPKPERCSARFAAAPKSSRRRDRCRIRDYGSPADASGCLPATGRVSTTSPASNWLRSEAVSGAIASPATMRPVGDHKPLNQRFFSMHPRDGMGWSNIAPLPKLPSEITDLARRTCGRNRLGNAAQSMERTSDQ